MSVSLGEATAFATFDSASQTFTFKLEKGAEYKTSYDIDIVLTDNNATPKSSKHKLSIIIEGKEEETKTVIDTEEL